MLRKFWQAEGGNMAIITAVCASALLGATGAAVDFVRQYDADTAYAAAADAAVLSGAALIREREHGTVEHLLVMPVTPFEIMASKVWAMGLVVLLAAAGSLNFVVQGLLKVPIEGSVALFLAGAALHLFATTSMGIFLATVARSMPQFGMLLVLTLAWAWRRWKRPA